MKRIIYLFTLISFQLQSQTWQFVKPYNEPGYSFYNFKLKQLSNGNLIRTSAFSDHSRIQSYIANGDTLWKQDIKHLYIYDITNIGDSIIFVGSFDSTIVLSAQNYFCPDTCVYGIRGFINKDGNFKGIKIISGHEIWLRSVSVKNNRYCISGGFTGFANFDSITVTTQNTEQVFVATMDSKLKILRAGHTISEYASSFCSSLDNAGNVWVFAHATHSPTWNDGTNNYPFIEGTTWGGQQLFKLDQNLKFLWDKSIFMGIGPERFQPIIYTDSLNSGTLVSLSSWGSGFQTHTTIRKYDYQGKEWWHHDINSYQPLLGQDDKDNLYTISGPAVLKYARDGTLLSSNTDTAWHHTLYTIELTGEDEFFGLGICSNASFNCSPGDKLLTYYGFTKAISVPEIAYESQNIKLFPNPCTGIFYLKCREGSIITITNYIGTDVMKYYANKEIEKIELPNVAEGIYFAEILAGNIREVKKIVIHK